MQKDLSQNDFGVLAICAIRYSMGRQTYMPSMVRRIVDAHMEDISDNDLKVMIEDCRMQAEWGNWGSETIDKPGWLAWKSQLEAEMERRQRSD